MSFDYDALRLEAQAIIAEFGATATLTRTTTTYSPTTGNATGTPTNYSGVGVVFDREVRDRKDSTVRATEQVAYLSLAMDPAPGDELTVGGTKYRVVTSKPLRPATVTVLHEAVIVGL